MSVFEDYARRSILEQNPELLGQVERVTASGSKVTAVTTGKPDLILDRDLDGAVILAEVERVLRRYVVVPENAYLPVVLYAICTHVAEAFDSIGYLAILSPTKGCGKTRLFEVLELFVRKPWRGIAPSVAALFRKISEGPTLLLDEVEVFNRKDKSETTQTLLAVLNGGYRKGATIPRCDGPNHNVRDFPTYGPKCFAAIGRLPDTLIDRCIVIRMQRHRRKSEHIERFLSSRARREAAPIHQNIDRWAADNHKEIVKAYEKMLETDLDFLTDRNAEIWIPLFSICAIATPERIDELKHCAQALCANKAVDDTDDSLPLKLLADIREVWPEGETRCDSMTLIERLRALVESPWSEYELTPRKLARMLRPFGVEPRLQRMGQERGRGYEWADLEPVVTAYLDSEA